MITVYQYIYDKMIKKREEMHSYLLCPLIDDLPEEYKPIRELYYTGSAKGKSCVEKMIIKTADDLLLFQLEKMDKLRLLENGQDMFSMELKPKEYNSIVSVPKNLSFCSIMKELIEEENNNHTSRFVY
ncbi:transposase [Xenorhabdus bovienii]|uniref:transposase n=1 Tax=Xenorhabdus bovienii TaxID=40576 RepID=UPI0023B2E9BF|nr:transposase [Xenorhabdus bovienii]MDE9459735.1 transposase [Xenorhabdus bovienii]MDE9488154.1 transposase [Xenorhabdus bovienii]MDE9516067.1 transposase [Xenorhabdus bovienii]